MKLRQLYESTENKVAIIFGRFNPPHKGHKAAWELASQADHWYVGTNESTQGPKDPLPFDVKIKAMETIWPEVKGHIVAETSWLTLASKVYDKFPDATLLCLTDEDWVTKTIQQYNGKEGPHGFYNFKNIEQQPTPRLSSATALRSAVQAGDRKDFEKAAGVPADTPVDGKPFFDLVAEYLMPYAEKEKAKAEKKKKKEPEVAEGMFGIDSKTKGAIQNVVSQLSDIPGMWDHEEQTFTDTGLETLEAALKHNPQYIKYAVNLTADDFDADLEEVTLGDYRKKAKMAAALAAMSKAFGRSPEEREKAEKELGRRERGLARLGSRDEKRKQAQDLEAEKRKQAALDADKENLPQLKADLEKLEAKFDPYYEYSDDHSFWSKQRDLAAQIGALKRRIAAVEKND